MEFKPEIYPPSEDSFFLSDVLKKEISKIFQKNPMLKILEIGAGSGIQAETILSLKIPQRHITLTDINLNAVKVLESKFKGIKIIHSDLFGKIHGKFDIIVFNPPYLPEDSNEPKDSQLATTGGKKGSRIINKFLKQAKNHLNKDGKIFILVSSLTKKIKWLDYKKRILERKKLFFEELAVLELSQR